MSATTVEMPTVLPPTPPSDPQGRSLIFHPALVQIGYAVCGDGPPLVLVHGAFSDNRTNWSKVMPHFEPHFTVFAIARRGRGATNATSGHRLEDERDDVAELIRQIGAPVALLAPPARTSTTTARSSSACRSAFFAIASLSGAPPSQPA